MRVISDLIDHLFLKWDKIEHSTDPKRKFLKVRMIKECLQGEKPSKTKISYHDHFRIFLFHFLNYCSSWIKQLITSCKQQLKILKYGFDLFSQIDLFWIDFWFWIIMVTLWQMWHFLSGLDRKWRNEMTRPMQWQEEIRGMVGRWRQNARMAKMLERDRETKEAE